MIGNDTQEKIVHSVFSCFPLAIPNVEIRKIFTTQIMEYIKENVPKNGEMLKEFCLSLKDGKPERVEEILGQYLKRTISIRDTFVKKKIKYGIAFYKKRCRVILDDGWSPDA